MKEIIINFKPFCAALTLTMALSNASVALAEDKWLTIDTRGKPCAPFVDVEPVMFERALKYGFKDAQGKTIIEPKYWHVEPFHNGLSEATESQQSQCKIIDRSGTEKCVIPPNLIVAVTAEFSGPSADGLLPVKRRLKDANGATDEEIGIFNVKTQRYIPLGMGLSVKEFAEGLAAVYTLGPPLYGFVDENGRTVIARKYEYADNFSEGLAAVLLNNKWCYVDRQGKIAIELPESCSLATSFHDGRAAVALGGSDTNPGYLKVRVNSQWGFIDKSGKVVVPAKFFLDRERGLGKPKNIPQFASGLANVATGNELQHEYGFIDKNGEWIIKPQYKDAEDFQHGCARVCLGTIGDFLSGWNKKERNQYRRETAFALFLQKYKLIKMNRTEVIALLGTSNKSDFGALEFLNRLTGNEGKNANVTDTYDLYTTANASDHRSVEIQYEKGIATRYRYVGTRDAGAWFNGTQKDNTLD